MNQQQPLEFMASHNQLVYFDVYKRVQSETKPLLLIGSVLHTASGPKFDLHDRYLLSDSELCQIAGQMSQCRT